MHNRLISAMLGPKSVRPLVHPIHEVAWCSSGSAIINAAGVDYRIDTDTALWIPAFTLHSPRLGSGALVVRADLATSVADIDHVVSVSITPELREALTIYAQPGAHTDDELERGAQVIVDAFTAAQASLVEPPASLVPRLPVSPGVIDVARRLLDDPTDSATCAQLAATVHLSERTLRRRFETETGLTFSQWRTRVRVIHAISRLSAGDPVDSVARQCGYASTAAFRRSFRSVTGTVPSEYRSTPVPVPS